MPVIRTLNKDSKYSRYKSNLRNSQKSTSGHNFWLLFGLILAILAVLFVIFYPTIKENLFGKAGGTGGSAFELTCPDGSLATGIIGRSGALIDSLGLKCGETQSLVYGGSGGSSFESICPGGEYLTGLEVKTGYSGQILVIASIIPYCDGQLYYPRIGGDTLSASIKIACPSGYAITGLKGRSGALVDSIEEVKCDLIPTTNTVTLYDGDFTGARQTFSSNTPTLVGSKIGDKKASSIKVGSSVIVTVYDGYSYLGNSQSFAFDYSLVGTIIGDNNVSSLKIEPASKPISLQLSLNNIDEITDEIQATLLMSNSYRPENKYQWYLNGIELNSVPNDNYNLRVGIETVGVRVGENTLTVKVFNSNKNSLLMGVSYTSFTVLESAYDEWGPPPPQTEICDNTVDDDVDGQADCNDIGDCSDYSACNSPPPGSLELTACGPLNEEGATYVLMNDIPNALARCFSIEANDITLDCQDHKINSNLKAASLDVNGIEIVGGYNNVIVKNCKVSGFDNGIKILQDNLNAVLINNELTYNLIGVNVEDRVTARITGTASCWNNLYDFLCLETASVTGSSNNMDLLGYCADGSSSNIDDSGCGQFQEEMGGISCEDGQEINGCVCNNPGLDEVNGICTSAISSIRSALGSTMETLQKISAIANALRTYFGLS